MNHLIVRDLTSGSWQEFEVGRQDIDAFQNAKKILVDCLDMEIIYDQVIEEFWEYKNKVDYWRFRYFSCEPNYILNHEIRHSLNRLAFNLLNISKLFLDKHYSCDGDKCFSFNLTGCELHKQKIKEQRDDIFRSDYFYRIGYKLRNWVQHNSLPVSNFTAGIKNDPASKKRLIDFKINYSVKDMLDMGVSKEIIGTNELFDLTEIINGYVFSISKMHFLNRDLIEESVSKAKQSIIDFTSSKASTTGYEIYVCEFEPESEDTIYAGLEWFDVVHHLRRKHSHLVNYANFRFDD